MKVPYNYLPMEFKSSGKIQNHWKKLIRSADFTKLLRDKFIPGAIIPPL